MTREELLARLKALAGETDIEYAHGEADAALLAYINDEAVTTRFNRLKGWYA